MHSGSRIRNFQILDIYEKSNFPFLLSINSQAPERLRSPRARCARSGENGEGWVRLLQKFDKRFKWC